MSILQINTENLSLESQLDRLALEANVLTNIVDIFKNILPNLSAKISDLSFVKSETQYSEIIKNINKHNKQLKEKLNFVNFKDYEALLVSVPEDFQGDLLAYVILLNKLVPEVYGQANKILSEYNTMLSLFISDKESKISIHDETQFFKNITKQREDFSKQISHFFPTNTGRSKKRLDQVISRFADLDILVENTSKLDKNHVAQNMENTAKSVKKCVDQLNIIINDINIGAINNVSGAASMNIATGAYEVAKYVEFISIFRFKTEQALVSVDKLVEKLDTII